MIQELNTEDLNNTIIQLGLPWWLNGKESTYSAGDTRDAGLSPRSGRSSGGRAWQPTPVFLPGEFHAQGSVAG